MMTNSEEQSAIIYAPLKPISVIACAGSGKTRTAVRRLAEIRHQLGEHRGRVALLSFSNIAVNTFAQNYQELLRTEALGAGGGKVEIDTLDGFITRNILHPHAHRTMRASQTSHLVFGNEPFLKGFTFWTGDYPLSITQMEVSIEAGMLRFYYKLKDKKVELPRTESLQLIERLGKTGAYTHNLGRYWCLKTLQEQPSILRALVRRYPQILIDEAQDIGTMHQAIIEQLITAGAIVSLIGDPNQGIYEFAGANGQFLITHSNFPHVSKYELTRNYRSVPAILKLANCLSSRTDYSNRTAADTLSGPYFVPYKANEKDKLIDSFHEATLAAGLKIENSAVICRGRELANKLSGKDAEVGQGIVKDLALATILRDKHHEYLESFKLLSGCISSLLSDPPRGFTSQLIQSSKYPELRPIRRILWSFLRDANLGLPSSELIADSQWHPLLVLRIKALLKTLEINFDLRSANNLGNKLAKKALPNAPLLKSNDLASPTKSRLRIDTVHQVKGESLDAVLYIATSEHVKALLSGVNSEVGRIGYVAVTRARDLFWLAVPASSLKELKPKLLAHGFKEVGKT